MLFRVAGIVQVYRKYEKLESFLVSIDNDVAAVTRQKNFDGMCSNDHNDELVLFWLRLLFQTLILSMHLITVCYDNSNVFYFDYGHYKNDAILSNEKIRSYRRPLYELKQVQHIKATSSITRLQQQKNEDEQVENVAKKSVIFVIFAN